MKFVLSLIIGMSLALVSPILLASDSSVQELEAKIKVKQANIRLKQIELDATLVYIKGLRQELNALKKQLSVAKKPDHYLTKQENITKLLNWDSSKQTDGSSNLGKMADEVPCTCVFNKNREWNPEEIIWKENFWKCTNYKDDGTCTKVGVIEGKVVE